jgi:uncharacterized protein
VTRFFAFLLAALAFAGAAFAAPQFPALTGRVVDAANVLPPDMEQRITEKSEALEKSTGRQFVVATLPSLQGYDIADYGYQLGRAWGIGEAKENTGALLIVAPSERRVRIEVGYGLEGVLTDALSNVILQQRILPKFKAGDLPGGVEDGANAVIDQLQLPPDQAQAKVTAAAEPESQIDWGFVVFIAFWALWFLLAATRARRFGRRSTLGGAIPPVIIWGGNDWGGGGRGGWGGGSGGGFSGGGGSFGGGGSSGSW